MKSNLKAISDFIGRIKKAKNILTWMNPPLLWLHLDNNVVYVRRHKIAEARMYLEVLEQIARSLKYSVK